MATWPSGTKAGTTNLDAGTDSPRLARPDIKTNVDNVNAIIDMFNIDSPSANQILKYNSSNARFELGTDSTGTAAAATTFVGDDSSGTAVNAGETFKIAGGTNITTAVSGDTVTITGPTLTSFITASSSDTLTNKSGAVSMFTNDAGYITNNGNGDITFVGSTITSPSNADITLDPAGTGVINNNATVRFNVGYQEDINALTSSTGITVDAALASVHTVTLAHSTTFTISNLPTGGSVTIIITQDGTGSNTGAFTSTKFAGGTPTLSTDANAIDVVTIFNDGTNKIANIAKAFA
jgi:hypothetical protein